MCVTKCICLPNVLAQLLKISLLLYHTYAQSGRKDIINDYFSRSIQFLTGIVVKPGIYIVKPPLSGKLNSAIRHIFDVMGT